MREKLAPSGSQTVGPFFQIGLQHLIDVRAERSAIPDAIQLSGRVVDRDGVPVADALLEFWCADRADSFATLEPQGSGIPSRFCRAGTDGSGCYSVTVSKPGPVPFGDGRFQAPHFAVLIFARGLLRHLITRVYFEGEADNDRDIVLQQVPAPRRHTLIAKADSLERRLFRWDVVLQGAEETAFFAW